MSTTPASADYFERNANQWDRLRAGYFDESLRDAAIAKAYLRPEDVAADIGGGTGFISAGLASKVALVHLIDASPAMIATAREKLAAFDHVQYHLADGAALPLEDASVDAAFANMYLHHSTDPFAAIQEMVRILKPGGRLVITDLEHHENEWMKEEMADVWLGFEPDEIRSWFKTAGLVNIFIQGSGKTCCAESRDLASTDGASQARIGVFLAVGARPVEGVQAAVQQDYGQHAISGSSCCGSSASSSAGSCCSGSNEQLIFDQGYTPADLNQAPADAAEISLGCGNPLAMALLKEGDTVIDIGSGGG
ncbi:MAG TPA: methyltransferase domain-containing protein, partial [Anaerolineaceae bacterium]|nr:methyltransferase domain-containing protein [Anaerolineaceae bacterium]